MPAQKGTGLDTIRDGIVIPSGLVLLGTLIVRPGWIGYAVCLVTLLVAAKFYRGRTVAVLKRDTYQSFELVEKTPVCPNTALYRFALPTKHSILGLPTGQHITVACQIDGKEVARSYTPSSSDEDKGYFDLIVKSYPTGLVSKYFGQLQIHQTIKVKGPKGQMHYVPGCVRAFGMIAGGTGITPLLQIIRAVLRNPQDATKMSLIYANVTEEDIILREELDSLAAKFQGQFSVYHVLNNPPQQGWNGGSGFVTTDIIKAHCPAPAADIKLLMCGPPPMISAMKKATESLGYDKARAVSKMEDQVFSF